MAFFWGQARPGTMENIHGTLEGPGRLRYHGNKSMVPWVAQARTVTMKDIHGTFGGPGSKQHSDLQALDVNVLLLPA